MNPFNPAWVFAAGRSGVWYSEDGGATWHGLHNPGDPMALAGGEWGGVAPTNPEVVYTSDISSGVYRSDDGGESWVKLGEGLTVRAATGLAISADGMHLYAATSGGGVFRLDLNGQPPQPAPGVTPTIAPTSPPIAAAPTSTSPPAQPTAPPEVVSTPTPAPTGGRGICGGVAAFPLALMGLVWISCRRR